MPQQFILSIEKRLFSLTFVAMQKSQKSMHLLIYGYYLSSVLSNNICEYYFILTINFCWEEIEVAVELFGSE